MDNNFNGNLNIIGKYIGNSVGIIIGGVMYKKNVTTNSIVNKDTFRRILSGIEEGWFELYEPTIDNIESVVKKELDKIAYDDTEVRDQISSLQSEMGNTGKEITQIKAGIEQVSSQIDEIENQEIRTETLNNAVETYVNTAIDDGRMANLTIADDSIEGSKIKDGQITKNKLESKLATIYIDMIKNNELTFEIIPNKIQNNTGEILDNTKTQLSDYIPVYSSKSYKRTSTGAWGSMCEYDENKNWVKGHYYTAEGDYEFTTSPITKYIRISNNKGTVLKLFENETCFEINKDLIDSPKLNIRNTTENLIYKPLTEGYGIDKTYLENGLVKYSDSKISDFILVSHKNKYLMSCAEWWCSYAEFDEDKNFLGVYKAKNIIDGIGEINIINNATKYIRCNFKTNVVNPKVLPCTKELVIDDTFVIPSKEKRYIAKSTVDVTDFGAIGDGVSDDTEAFKKAISHIVYYYDSGTLIIPDGTYKITETLNFWCDKLTIEGSGAILDFTSMPDDSNCIVVRTYNSYTDSSSGANSEYSNNIRRGHIHYCKGLYIKGNKNITGVLFTPSINGSISCGFNFEHCVFTSFDIAIKAGSNSWVNSFISCNISNNNIAIDIPSGGVNYCERFTIIDSNIHSNQVALRINHHHAHIHAIGTSFDYNYCDAEVISGRVYLTDCHIETTKDTNYNFIVTAYLFIKNCEWYIGKTNFELGKILDYGVIYIDGGYIHNAGYYKNTLFVNSEYGQIIFEKVYGINKTVC